MSPFLFTPFLLIFFLLSEVSCHGGSDHHSTSSPYPDLRSRSLIYAKLWSLLIVFAGTFAGGMSPYFLKWNRELLSAGTEFAGGVFLSTAMIHFLSDANETFTDLTSISYPFAFMLACAGYLITMLADSLVLCAFKMRSKASEVESAAEVGEEGCRNRYKEVLGNVRLGDVIVMVGALCFHSIFEGIAIGVASTRSDVWRALWTVCLHKVFAAVAMGIALLQMMPKRRFISCLAYSFAFSISTPVGVAIGILVDATTEGVVADWVYAISMGIACGVFVYVSINHLMSKDNMVEDGVSLGVLLRRFIAVSSGVAVIAVVMIWDT